MHSKEGIGQTTQYTTGCTDAHHEKAQPAAHDDLISERVADGHVPVHRHDGEKTVLSDPKEEEDVHLGHTSSKRDGSPLAENVHKHLGHCRGGVAHVQQGEDSGEEVHGCVEACVLVYEGDEEAVAHKDQQVKKTRKKVKSRGLVLGFEAKPNRMNSVTVDWLSSCIVLCLFKDFEGYVVYWVLVPRNFHIIFSFMFLNRKFGLADGGTTGEVPVVV